MEGSHGQAVYYFTRNILYQHIMELILETLQGMAIRYGQWFDGSGSKRLYSLQTCTNDLDNVLAAVALPC